MSCQALRHDRSKTAGIPPTRVTWARKLVGVCVAPELQKRQRLLARPPNSRPLWAVESSDSGRPSRCTPYHIGCSERVEPLSKAKKREAGNGPRAPFMERNSRQRRKKGSDAVGLDCTAGCHAPRRQLSRSRRDRLCMDRLCSPTLPVGLPVGPPPPRLSLGSRRGSGLARRGGQSEPWGRATDTPGPSRLMLRCEPLSEP